MLDILIGCKRSGCTFLVGGRKIDGVSKVDLFVLHIVYSTLIFSSMQELTSFWESTGS